MSELNEQQVSAVLRNLLQQRDRATVEGSETQSYLHLPFIVADAPVLERVLPKLIGPSHDVTIDTDTSMLHVRFATPEGYDQPAQTPQSAEEFRVRLRTLESDPEAYKRALEEAMRDTDEAPPQYGKRAADEFFQMVEHNANEPRALTAAVNAGESQEAKLEACLDEYYANRPRSSTMNDDMAAHDRCTIESRKSSMQR